MELFYHHQPIAAQHFRAKVLCREGLPHQMWLYLVLPDWPQLVSLTCCLDGIDGRLGRAAFQGSKLCFNFFCFCVWTPCTHTQAHSGLWSICLVIKSIGCSHFQACQVYLLWFLVSWKLGICFLSNWKMFFGDRTAHSIFSYGGTCNQYSNILFGFQIPRGHCSSHNLCLILKSKI